VPSERDSGRVSAAPDAAEGASVEDFGAHGVNIDAALGDSCLGELPPAVLKRLCAGAQLLRYAAGTEVPRTPEPEVFQPPSLIVEGLFRVVRRHVSGREVTARYVSVGDLVGLWGVLGENRPLSLDAWLTTEVIHDTVVLAFDPAAFRAELDAEPAFGRTLSRYLFAQLLAAQDALAGSLLLPVRARVAGHLLDLAERREGELIVDASAQRLAAAVGSVREVVSRVLREMESSGLLRRKEGQVVLLDTAALHRVASGEGGGYWA
jgi:CRP/FNR family transcriptional regulator, cyclic AMP receptor protein